ncbi:MAG: acyl-CoA thioesterase [Candidatus Latescibacteria bacterium]|nr:acyl-CoA thioesterase [Candidatus Latescibacterota bacterium]
MLDRSNPALRVVLLPRDTNAHGTIFGGVILSHLDIAGAIEARKNTRHRVVTVAMHEVEFLAPVFVGDVVSFYSRTERTGRTSVTVKVEVEAERADRSGYVKVTEAEIVYVAIGKEGNPVPLESEP